MLKCIVKHGWRRRRPVAYVVLGGAYFVAVRCAGWYWWRRAKAPPKGLRVALLGSLNEGPQPTDRA